MYLEPVCPLLWSETTLNSNQNRGPHLGHLGSRYIINSAHKWDISGSSTWMSQEVSKWLGKGFNPLTNHLLTSWDIQVGVHPWQFRSKTDAGAQVLQHHGGTYITLREPKKPRGFLKHNMVRFVGRGLSQGLILSYTLPKTNIPSSTWKWMVGILGLPLRKTYF